MRRLPIYFVIDKHLPDDLTKEAIMQMVGTWKIDPYLLETMEIARVYYSKQGCAVRGFDEIYGFEFRNNEEIEIDNIFPLDLIAEHIKSNVNITTSEVKGDYKPFIIVFSGDTVSNSTHGDIMAFSTNFGNKTNMIVFDIGEKTNSVLIDTDLVEDKLKLSFNVLTRNKFHIRPNDDLDLFTQLLAFVANTVAKISKGTPQCYNSYVYELYNKDRNKFYSLELMHP